jgi:hypothetical protein
MNQIYWTENSRRPLKPVPEIGTAAATYVIRQNRHMRADYMRSGRCRSRGMESFGDLPRPERLGLVMK